MNISTFTKQVAIICLCLFFSISLKSQCAQSDGTIIVSSTADEGAGTLRDAINCANLSTGSNRIIFNIPTTDRAVILVGSTSGLPLPDIVSPRTIIDGSTQPGFGVNGNFQPKIVLDGSSFLWLLPINALKVFGDATEIYALEIRHFPDDGIDIEGGDNVIIGDEEKGNVIFNCGFEQDIFPASGNTAPYNGVGIVVDGNADNAQIISNIIGTDYEGNPNLGNEWCGIYIRRGSDFTLIENNIIADHDYGIRLNNVFAIKISENQLSCNKINGIQFVNGANDDRIPPIISAASNNDINGTGNPGNEIEVFVADNCTGTPCQGRTFLGRAFVQNDRSWQITAPYANNLALTGNESVTATATDGSNRTSAFGNCQGVTLIANCAPADGVIWVTTANDEGEGSLRAAIECANSSAGPNTIRFNIAGGGRQQINIGSTNGNELPFLRDGGTIIDGTTQPGYGAGGVSRPLIILDGGSYDWRFPHNALWIRADNCEIYGLEIRNFPDDGIDVESGDFTIIGAPNRGNIIYNCGLEKDFFEDSPNTGPWNGCGIVLRSGSRNNSVQGNIIGTDFAQTNTSGNELCGLILQNSGNNNQIGGTAPNEGNTFAYNQHGINMIGNSFNNRMQGNSFFCNAVAGISLSATGNNNQIPPNINIASLSVVNGSGVNGDIVAVYTMNTNCTDGPCQGTTLLGSVTVTNQTWRLEAPFLNGVTLAADDQITALATSSTGNTSEFAACRTVEGANPPLENCDISLGISNFSNETCNGNDGMFTLSTSNAVAPITYDVGDGATDNASFSNLAAGIYNVTVTDAEGCSTDLSVVISQNSTPSLTITNTVNEGCGQADGSVTVQTSDGTFPYIYEIGDGRISRSPTFDGLTAGSYIITVTDGNGCTATQDINIQQVGNINVSIADMRSDNCNNANGSFSIAASGGATPYTYDLGNGAVTSNNFSGLSAGDYTVTIRDANNCSTTANVNINGSSSPVLAIDNVSTANCSQPTGSVSLSTTGGTQPFQYDIGNGNINTPTFSNLAAGNYIVTVTDANNCNSTQSITINEPTSPSLSIVSTQNAACGNANGSASLLSSGGQSPYRYDIGFGITTDPNFNNLSEGSYTVTVTDNNGCQDEMRLEINNSPTPVVEIADFQNASCNQNNAIINVAAVAGEAPFTYDIGNGPISEPTFNNLSAGSYTVIMVDKNNCSASVSLDIESTGGPQLNIVNTSEAKCNKDNGSFSVSAVGGFAPFTYDIGNGATDSPEFYDLEGGNYVVTLTDANGCNATQSVTLGNVPAPTFGVGDITRATCGESNGGFNVSAFGGLAPYQFNVGGENTTESTFTDLSAGSYTVIVTDANSCTTALNVAVEGATMPEVSVVNTVSAQCGQTDGSFELAVNGGIAPYFFDIGEGETNSGNFANLAPGNYDVTISDASNCSQTNAITIEGAGEIELSIKNKLSAACGQENGAFTLSPSGGIAPYIFTVNEEEYTDSIFTNVSAGRYNITAKDAGGCSTLMEVEIAESQGPTVTLDINQQCGDTGAAVFVNAEQGQAPYMYDIGNGPTSEPNFTNIGQGLHRMKVIDSNGCESSKNFSINTSDQAPEASAAITITPACGKSDGSFKVNVSKGTPPYLYALDADAKSPFATFSNLTAGDYQVTVTDAGGCSTMVPVSLNSDAAMPIAAFDLNFAELEGTFSNTTQNGTSYIWDFGDGNTVESEDATNTYSEGGSYTICLTASNDCGRDTYCEDYTIEALNTNKAFEFDFGEVSGAVGDIIKVPVYVVNFKSIVGFQKSVHIADPEVAKFVAITDVTLKDLSAGLFSLKDFQYSVSWFEGSIEGLTLPDSTIIYQIEIELLADNKCTDIIITDDPLQTQVYEKIGNDELEIAYFKRKGTVCAGDGGNTGGGGGGIDNPTISGLIATELDLPVSAVTIACTDTEAINNEIDGTYLFENLATPKKYTLTPSKNINPLNGVTTFDLVIIQNHILGNKRLDSPYKIIGADVNQSGAVTVSDILELRKLLLLNITDFTNNESWRFIPKEYEFPDPSNPLQAPFPESTSFNLTDKNLTANFVAIKIGDANDSATPNEFVRSKDRNNKVGTFTLKTNAQYLQKGETTTITFHADELTQITGFQYTMQLDNEFIQIESVHTNNLFNKNNMGQRLINKGYLLTSWVKETPTLFTTNSPLFSLTIKAKKAGNLSDLIQINSDFLAAEAYNLAGQLLHLDLEFVQSEMTDNSPFELFQNKPNPFTQFTVINYHLPNEATVQLNLFDIQGKLLKSIQNKGEKGKNQFLIQPEDLTSNGLIYYQLNTPFGQLTKKMLRIE